MAYSNCLICESKFYASVAKQKLGYSKYCSRKCFAISHTKTKAKVTCQICNVIFDVHQCRKNIAKFCTPKCRNENNRRQRHGSSHPNWKGGRRVDSSGYVWVYAKNHPKSYNKYIREHRLVMENIIGRHLSNEENVHHKNGIKTDNRPDNLELVMHNNHFGEVRCPHCLKEFKVK